MDVNDMVIAVNLEVTYSHAALVNRQGTLIRQETSSIGSVQGEGVAAVLAGQLENLLAHAALKYLKVEGIGISIPGISDQQNRTVWSTHLKGWEKFPLFKYLKDHLTRQELPIIIEGEPGCSLMGEVWLGAARNSNHAVFISVGQDINAGLMMNGRLVKGSHGLAGALGWMALDQPYDNKFKAAGQLNYFASETGLVRNAKQGASKFSGRFFQKASPGVLEAQDLFKAYENKEDAAVKSIDHAIELWGMASAGLVSLMNPEVLIFGGSMFGPGIQFLDRIYREAIRWAHPVSMRQVKFLAAELKEYAALLGAAHMVFDHTAG